MHKHHLLALGVLLLVIVAAVIGSTPSSVLTTGSATPSLTRTMSADFGVMEDSSYAFEAEETAAQDIARDETFIIKTGDLDLQVNSVEDAMEQLTTIAQNNGGSVETSGINNFNDERTGYATLRVDVDRFDSALQEIADLATVVNSIESDSSDVTDQVVDIQARLSNAQAQEQSYLSVLDRAESVEDILNVQDYLYRVRETIERYQAQLDYYQSATSQSTITVFMTEGASVSIVTDNFLPGESFKEALQTVVEVFQGLITAVIWIVVLGVSIGIPAFLLFLLGRTIYRRINK